MAELTKEKIYKLLEAIEEVTSCDEPWREKKSEIIAAAGDSSDSGMSLYEFTSWFPPLAE